MSNFTSDRVLFNELVTLLDRLNPSAINELKQAFPEFADEIVKGPDAGATRGDINYALRRANFALAASEKVVREVEQRVEKIIRCAASLHTGKLTVTVLGGIGGAATLAAIGLSKDDVSRIAGIVTSFVAILNGVFEHFSKRYSVAETQRAAELRKSAFGLAILNNKLESQIKTKRDISEIRETTDRCNELASELIQKQDLLRTV